MGLMDTLLGGSALAAGGSGLVAFSLPSAYGYVILVAISSVFLLIWQGVQVGKMRKKLKVEYPTMYSADSPLFNCYQRAHQNTLENYTQFLLLLGIGGLEMPILSAIAGLVWIAGRVSYSKGYYTGDPKNRSRGAFAYIGLLTLLGASLKFACHLLCP